MSSDDVVEPADVDVELDQQELSIVTGGRVGGNSIPGSVALDGLTSSLR